MQKSQTTNSTPLSAGDPYAEYLGALVREGLLIPTGVQGVYGRSGVFEDVIQRFDAFVTRVGGNDGAAVMRFPSILPRDHFERSDYLKSFPHLAGTVHSFNGDEHDHKNLLFALERGEDWSKTLAPTEVVLTPAACYPIYPTLTGAELEGQGRLFDVLGICFRHEPSPDPARMQMFRQREYV